MNFLHQHGGLHMVLNGKSVTIAKTDRAYADVAAAIKGGNASEADIINILDAERIRMAAAVEVAPGIDLKGGELYYKGESIDGVLGERMLQMLEEGFDLVPMSKFLGNLMQNPSKRVVEHLYAFLEHGKNPITEDGHFLAYKAIRADWRDIHSGNFDNSIGAVLSMPRNKVDENPNNTCSAGFHVCSFDYLPSFANADGHVVVCKVNPADVVAIPADYNNTKMRTARYEVISEYEGYYKTPEDTLANASVRAAHSPAPFVVEVDYSGNGSFDEDSQHESLVGAATAMAEVVKESDCAGYAVRLVNTITGTVVDEAQLRPVLNSDFDDEGGEVGYTYALRGVRQGAKTALQAGFETLAEAVVAALDASENFDSIEVVDWDGDVVKTVA